MPDNPNNPFQFWQELKRRKVVRVIIVYAAASFVILELVSIIAEPFGLPDWTIRFVFIILCIGLIISIILSWIYDITPEGIEKTKPVKEVKEEVLEKPSTVNAWKIATFISIVIIVGLIIFNIVGRREKVEYLAILDKSIAVLPFKSLSDDPEKQYLADGAMDAILLHLSKIEDLRVMARTSVEQYRETDKTASTICQELDVTYLLEGSFQKYGDQARLIVQLIAAGKEDHVWANEYDRKWGNIFSVQSEIAQLVAAEIKARITPEEKQLIEKIPTTNLTAYDFYLRGLDSYRSHLDFETSAEYFEKAIKFDSTFALAYSYLAQSYQFIARYSLSNVNLYQDAHLKAKEAALKAYELDPLLGEALAVYGLILAEEWEIYTPEEIFKKAIKLSPGSYEVYSSFAQYLRWQGRYDECISLAKQAMELDPLNPMSYQWLAVFYVYSGQYNKSIQQLEKALDLNPEFTLAHFAKAVNYSFMDMNEEAIAHADKFMSDPISEDLILFSHITWVYAKTGLEAKARKQLEYMLELSKTQFVDPVYLAIAYAGLGENDNAFSCLSNAFELHSGQMIYLRAYADWFFKDLSSDPRYIDLLEKIGFEVN